MQISSSSSALSRISRAVLRVRCMVVVECSIFSIPLKDLERKPTGKSNSNDKDCPAVEVEQVARIVIISILRA